MQKIGTKGSEFIIKQLSSITKNLGGPEFILPAMSVLLGVAFEYNIKGLVKHGLIEAIAEYSIPFITLIVKFIGLVATFIAAYEIVEAFLKSHNSHTPDHNQEKNNTESESPVKI